MLQILDPRFSAKYVVGLVWDAQRELFDVLACTSNYSYSMYSDLQKCRESLAVSYFAAAGKEMMVEVDNCQLPAK